VRVLGARIVGLNQAQQALSGDEKTSGVRLDYVENRLGPFRQRRIKLVEVQDCNYKSAAFADFDITKAIIESIDVVSVIPGKLQNSFHIIMKSGFCRPVGRIETAHFVAMLLQPGTIFLQNVLAKVQTDGTVLQQLVVQPVPHINGIESVRQGSLLYFLPPATAAISFVAEAGRVLFSNTYWKMSGAMMVASDSMTKRGVVSSNLPQVIFSFGTAPLYEP